MAKKRSIRERAKELLKQAEKLKADGATWTQGHNTLFGPGGPAAQLFSTREDRVAFSKTDEHTAIHEILANLPKPKNDINFGPNEASGKILVRVPKSVHAALLAEAEAENVSLNQLIVSKLSTQLRALV